MNTGIKRIRRNTRARLLGATVTAVAILAGCHAFKSNAKSLTLIEKGGSGYVVVYDEKSAADQFAVKELNEIVKASMGIGFETADVNSDRSKTATKRILVGRNAMVRKALGDERLNSLKKQESLVTSRGNDLILVGGGDLGTQYAVYDFVEDEAGYRCFAPYPGGDRFIKTDRLVYSGKETRRIPAFPGYRINYGKSKGKEKFIFRNRGGRVGSGLYTVDGSYGPRYRPEFHRVLGSQHGLFYYVPPYDADNRAWLGVKQEGMFKEHPEYYSMKKDGARTDDAQLCFSNPELRKLFTERFLEIVKKNGKGVYMVGSNDHQNERYCSCPGCLTLEKKYNSAGGPLWDYVLELCALLKKDYPGVYVTSLAYKGPGQTEKAPDGVVFPGNFICDAAFLNSDRSLREIPAQKLENGEVFQKFENLKKWRRITGHVSYWYYGGGTPCLVYGRAQKELKELRDAGVKSVGACGTGGGVEFGDIAEYLYYRLLLDPDMEARAAVGEFAEFKYGSAAAMMMNYIDELENALAKTKTPNQPCAPLGADDSYDKIWFLTPEQIVRWRKDFDKMLEWVKDDPVRSRNVRIARIGVDVWTIIFMPRIQKAFPALKMDPADIMARGFKACDEAEQAQMVENKDNVARRILNSMSLYAYLKDDSIPVELKPYPKERIIRYLPVQPPDFFPNKRLTEDQEAVAQFTMKAKILPEQIKNGVHFENYDLHQRKWILGGDIPKTEFVPGKYKLYRLGIAYLPQSCRVVFGGLWGTALDIEDLGRYFDPSCQKKQYEYWASLKFDGPAFDPDSKDQDSYISCDDVFLVDMGMPKE